MEALIHYRGIYAACAVEKMVYEGIHYFYAQIQPPEYLPESKEREENMSAIAARPGIIRGNFTKIVNRPMDKGLPEERAWKT